MKPFEAKQNAGGIAGFCASAARRVRMYGMGVKIGVAARMAYRADLAISLFIMLIVEMGIPLITWAIYANGASFPGWSMHEVLLVQSIFMLARGIAFPTFFGMVWNIIRRVQDGTFDLILIKPGSALYVTIITGFETEDLGKLVGGAGLMALALTGMPAPTALQWLGFAGLFVSAMAAMFGIAVIMSGIGIVWIGNFRIYDMFLSVTNFANYPTTIFSKAVQTLAFSVLPIAILGYVPASVLIGRPDAHLWIALATGFGTAFVGLLFWKWMMKRYTSAGG